MILLVLMIVLACVAVAGWGPGNHLEFAHRVYRSRRKTLTAAKSHLLREQRAAYFYGNIAADIINFKAWGGHYNHCHRWTIVEDMLSHAENDAEEAFCLGYLSHLAADTVAHNHFVPYHMARYGRSKSLGHVYWEMRADSFVPETRWQIVTSLKNDRQLDDLDELVNRTVPKKALSMRTNKLLFNHVLLISERDRWRRGVERLQGMASAPLDKSFLETFRQAAVGRIRLALTGGGVEKLSHIDTNGKAAQRQAWEVRKKLLRRMTSPTRRRRESAEAAAAFLDGMESPPVNGGTPHW